MFSADLKVIRKVARRYSFSVEVLNDEANKHRTCAKKSKLMRGYKSLILLSFSFRFSLSVFEAEPRSPSIAKRLRCQT
jgi:hypothetical protein